jgi:hypothetical protein
LRLGAQPGEHALGLRDDCGIALGFAERDQLERLIELALDPAAAFDRTLEPRALTQQVLRRRRVVPQLGVLGLGVQLGETAGRAVPVKDASSAAPATF